MQERATLNLIRLDPGRRHGYVQAEYVTDLRALCNAIESAEKFRRTPPTSILPLEGSAAGSRAERRSWMAQREEAKSLPPAEILLTTPALSLVLQLIEQL